MSLEDIVYNEKALLGQVATGDKAAFEMVYRRYYDKYYAIALTYLYMPDRAEDVLQELFLRLWNKREKLVQVADFSAYLYVMLRNMIITEMRNKKRQLEIVELSDVNQVIHASVHPQTFNDELPERINHLILTLPQKQQTIYRLSREDGLNHTEISDLLQLSPRTVSNTISLVLGHLRKSLVEQGFVLKSFSIILPYFF